MERQREQELELKNAQLEKELAAKNRDLEIEASLERLRARGMAMQRSDELADLISAVFTELAKLRSGLSGCALYIMDEISSSAEIWLISPANVGAPECLQFVFPSHSFSASIVAAWKERLPKWTYELKGDQKLLWHDYLLSETDFSRLPDAVKAAMRAPERLRYSFSFNNFGGMQTVGEAPLPDADLDILSRFSKVFDQTYTRFTDLKQAEAQARGAKIELALERVRARTMAMQRSEELAEVAFILFEQFKDLGESPDQATIGIVNEYERVIEYWVTMYGSQINKVFKFSIDEPNVTRRIYQGWKQQQKSLVIDLSGKELYDFTAYRASMGGAAFNPLEKRRVINVAFFSKGLINVQSSEARSQQSIRLLERFAGVFEGTYTRFLDLKRAEAQAKEAQTEAALERVRSRTMGMQKSEDLKQIINVVFEQLVELNIFAEHAGFIMDYKANDDMHIWLADKHYTPSQVTVPYFDSPTWNSFNQAKAKGLDFFANQLTFEEKNKFYQDLFKFVPGVTDQTKEYYFNCPGLAVSTVLLENVGLYIENFSGIPYTQQENATLMRFGKVFQQTYTRFLDLQTAEAQAREALIEAALERTRTQSMMMQRSNQLDGVLRVFHEQVLRLGIDSAFSFLWLPDEQRARHIFWAAWAENDSNTFKSKAIDYPLVKNEPATAQCLIDWQGSARVVAYHVPPQGVNGYFAAWQELIDGVEQLKPEYFSGGLYYVEAFMKYGCFGVMVKNELPEEHKKILARLATEFERTYTRFLDLQKAERQTRESQIELSLERVRAKTMAMHTSEHVGETVATMFDELVKLGIENTARCGIGIIGNNQEMELWRASYNTNGEVDTLIGHIDMTIHPLLKGVYQAWANKQTAYSYELTGEDQQAYFQALNDSPAYAAAFDLAALPPKQINSVFFFPEGCVYSFTHEALSEDEHRVLKRFAGVFGQTYRRYLDLQKAEVQAREAQIESAMEKVRSRSLAMQKPADLVEVAQLLRREMALLGVEELETSSIYIHHELTGNTECWYAIKDHQAEHKLVADHMDMFLDETWVGRQMLAFYRSSEKRISIPMQGDNRREWINYCSAKSKLLDGFYGHNIPDRTYHLNKFSNGYMGAASPGDISAESWELLQRATAVFSFAYTRFSDLQQAEAQAREAQIEAGLERVRSRTMAMQASDELAETAAVVFKQLIGLGIAPNRLFIGIIPDEGEEIELWATDEDGSRISTRFTGRISRNASVKKMYDGWKRKKRSITIDMKGKELRAYFHYLAHELKVPFKLGLTQERRVQSVAYFSKGFIGMASPDEQPEETVKLLERFAGVFNLTFIRFHDLKLAEAHAIQAEQDLILLQTEKNRAEDALSELRSTQSQLVQREKMASLGELTAGIAHEIQNPLNFVNNFSEVSRELMDELTEELDKGDTEQAKAITQYVIENLAKINHHGRRADSIVKGMLEHSRVGTGQKQPSDLNLLADEFLKLSYHGLRAKDKSFNVELIMHFDAALPKANVVQQDIGRVLVNLFNNAFYAVKQKFNSAAADYKPTVEVSTSSQNSQVIIKVKDNGVGIPDAIKGKILQPFFTTKPTGEGTGLGLSLSYDILVKGHNGTLDVVSKEGEGSEFIVSLPVN